MLASASGDRTVKLWDAGWGAMQHTPEGHPSIINAVAFLLDGKMPASASDDRAELLDPHINGHPITFNHYLTDNVQKAQSERRKRSTEDMLKTFF